MMGAATEKARLPRFSLVLGIESCCEVVEPQNVTFPKTYELDPKRKNLTQNVIIISTA